MLFGGGRNTVETSAVQAPGKATLEIKPNKTAIPAVQSHQPTPKKKSRAHAINFCGMGEQAIQNRNLNSSPKSMGARGGQRASGAKAQTQQLKKGPLSDEVSDCCQ
jgi:hypothetical protein